MRENFSTKHLAKLLIFIPMLIWAAEARGQFDSIPLQHSTSPQGISLEVYRDSVYRNSSEIENALIECERALAATRSAHSDMLPSLSADGSLVHTARRSGEDKRWGFSLTPQISQPIYGGGLRAAFRRAQREFSAAQYDADAVKLDIRYAADYAYWQVSAMKLYLDATDEYVEIIYSLYRIVQQRFEEGYAAKGDMLQVEARLSDAEFSHLASQKNYEVALHYFNNLRSAPNTMPARLAESITDSIPMPMRCSLAEIAARRPEVEAIKMRLLAAEYGVKQVRSSYNPQLSASLGGSWQTFSPNTSNKTYLDAALTLGVSVPIFHWGKRREDIRQAQSSVSILQNDWEDIFDDISTAEADGWSALESSYSQMRSSLRNLQIASDNLSISTFSYQEGQATLLDVLQAQISWIQIYTNAITSRFNYAVAVADYNRITASN